VVAYPDEHVFDAVTKMLDNNIGRLPVVDRNDPQKLVGYINRANVMGSWRGHLQEESVRERGWYGDFRERALHGEGGGVATGRVAGIEQRTIRITLDEIGEGPSEEFDLDAPARGVSVGDDVRIEYRLEKGHKIALRVVELSSRQ
jgi:CBS domain-containing protein